MPVDLDRESGEPLYRQVAAHLRARITAENLTRLPSLLTIGQEYDVSRPTAEAAVKMLADDGLVEVINGKGTFVRRQPELRQRAPPPPALARHLLDASGCVLSHPEPAGRIPVASRPMYGEDEAEQPRIHLRNSERRYVQVADDLEARIRAGEFPYDAAMPRREDLAHEYGVGEMTIRRAMRELAGRGLVRALPSVGTIVIWTGHEQGT